MLTLTLTWHNAGKNYSYIVPSERPILIGRDAICDIREVYPSVSARHIQVFCYQGAFYARNLKPSNPLHINDMLVQQSTRLHINDTLTFGGMTFRVQAIGQRQPRVRCHNCHNEFDLSMIRRDCPICGFALANSTVVS